MLFRCIHFKKKNNVHEKKLVAKPFHSVLNDIISSLMMFISHSICSFDSAIFLRVCRKVCISILRLSPSPSAIDGQFVLNYKHLRKELKSIVFIIKYNYIRFLIVNV